MSTRSDHTGAARRLAQHLKTHHGLEVRHTEALDLVATTLGHRNRQEMAAARGAAAARVPTPLQRMACVMALGERRFHAAMATVPSAVVRRALAPLAGTYPALVRACTWDRPARVPAGGDYVAAIETIMAEVAAQMRSGALPATLMDQDPDTVARHLRHRNRMLMAPTMLFVLTPADGPQFGLPAEWWGWAHYTDFAWTHDRVAKTTGPVPRRLTPEEVRHAFGNDRILFLEEASRDFVRTVGIVPPSTPDMLLQTLEDMGETVHEPWNGLVRTTRYGGPHVPTATEPQTVEDVARIVHEMLAFVLSIEDQIYEIALLSSD